MKSADLIVYGATGFTGQKVCHEIARNPPKTSLKWAIAGRNKVKLTKLLESLDLVNVPKPEVIVVDVQEKQELMECISKFKVLINCVGPFRLFGRPVFEACVEQKTDYVDICGETEFIEQMYADFNQKSIQNQVALVPACGYDSVPADLGAFFAKQKMNEFDSVCTQSEMFVSFGSGPSGVGVNATTFISAILGIASVDNLRSLRKKSHRKVSILGQSLHVYRSLRWEKRVNAWSIPAMVADVPVVKLGQQMIENHRDIYNSGEKFGSYIPPTFAPLHFAGYFAFTSWISVAYVSYLGFLFSAISFVPFLKDLMLKYPGFFTFGVFTEKGPSQKQLDESSFCTKFISKGYKKGSDYSGAPNIEIVTTVSGPEMGYVTTPICVLGAASMLLLKRDQIPHGVLTPSVAFSNVFSSLSSRLESSGIKFSFVSKRELK